MKKKKNKNKMSNDIRSIFDSKIKSNNISLMYSHSTATETSSQNSQKTDQILGCDNLDGLYLPDLRL